MKLLTTRRCRVVQYSTLLEAPVQGRIAYKPMFDLSSRTRVALDFLEYLEGILSDVASNVLSMHLSLLASLVINADGHTGTF